MSDGKIVVQVPKPDQQAARLTLKEQRAIARVEKERQRKLKSLRNKLHFRTIGARMAAELVERLKREIAELEAAGPTP